MSEWKDTDIKQNSEVYYLMNKDEILIKFKIKVSSGLEGAKECVVYRKPFWLRDLTEFLNSRKAPLHRQHISELLKQCKCDTLSGYLNFTHALSLNDTMWVKKESEVDLEWKKVSLYQNEFDETIAKIAFSGGMYGEQFSSLTPELGTNGQFAKCWVRENDDIFLIKRGSEGARNAGLEPYSEYYGSKIMGRICEKCVDYDLVKYRHKLATKCSLFTDEDYGFVPFSYVDYGKTMFHILEYLGELGFEHTFKDMIVGDTIIMNEDRHLGNFGFVIDNHTFEIVDFSPIFDHNLSLLCYGEKDDLENPERYMQELNKGHKLDSGSFLDLGRKFVTNENRKKIRSFMDYEIEKHFKYNLEDWRLEALNKQIRKQAEGLLSAQDK